MERPPQHRRRAEHVEQLRGRRDAALEPHRRSRNLERHVVRTVRRHLLKAWKMSSQPEELLLRPRSAEPEHADERDHIQRALLRSGGNKKAAAKMLGLSRRALYRRLERLDLSDTITRRRDNGLLAEA